MDNCLHCGNQIRGRSDKKFCDDGCRSTYYNEQNRDVNCFMKRINYSLRKNRRILSQLNPRQDKARVHRRHLSEKGFEFNFFTHTYVTRKGQTYFFCYEQGYLPLDNDYFALVTRKEYLNN